MRTDIARLAHMARTAPTTKFTSLMGLIFREEGLRDSFERLPGNKAPGVDGVRKDDYSKNLDLRINNLSERLRKLAYVPQPARRVYIPKAGGGHNMYEFYKMPCQV